MLVGHVPQTVRNSSRQNRGHVALPEKPQSSSKLISSSCPSFDVRRRQLNDMTLLSRADYRSDFFRLTLHRWGRLNYNYVFQL